MPNDISIEASIPAELDAALGRLASSTGQSKAMLVRQAVAEFLSSEEAFAAAVEEGRAAVRAGDTIDQDDVVRQIDALLAPKR